MHTFGYSIFPKNWDSKKRCIIGKGAEMINKQLETTLYEMRLAMFEVQKHDMSAIQLRDAILNHIRPEEEIEENETQNNIFIEYYRQVMENSELAIQTQKLYRGTYNHICKFSHEIEYLTFEEITPKWLEAFERYLRDYVPTKNGRHIHFRNIRAVFNRAINEDLTTAYPFRKFKFHSEDTIKRSLSVDELRTILSAEVPEHIKEAQDVFKLIFLLCGINIIDLMHLTQFNNGRVVYKRAKTKKIISIKVEPEAMEIFNKYKGDRYLLCFIERVAFYANFSYRLNQKLKYFSAELTTYWARHTWATVAAELDIPNETIAAALGHTYGNKTTSIYINFNQKKVDDANRRVIDYVLYGKK